MEGSSRSGSDTADTSVSSAAATSEKDVSEQSTASDEQTTGKDMQRVVCTSSHPVDLADGRSMASGATKKIDINNPHNAQLIEDEHLRVLDEEDN